MGGLLPGLGRVIWRGRGSVGRYGLRLSGPAATVRPTSRKSHVLRLDVAELFHDLVRNRESEFVLKPQPLPIRVDLQEIVLTVRREHEIDGAKA